MHDISAIKNYILYLKNQFGLCITLHPIHYESEIWSTKLMSFNIHDNSFCIFLKSCPEAYHHCISRQDKVINKCKDGSYIGTCYAGIKEFIYPITDGEKNIGFISISGYKTENASSYLKAVADKYCIDIDKLSQVYSTLKNELPSKQEIDTLIYPLCQMLELACIRSKEHPRQDPSFASRVEQYIKRYHNQSITSTDICKRFGCSRSYMSTKFNEHTGKSIREYINDLRLDDAKSLLKHSKLTVTEIAYSVGFTDSNYFSNLFKNKVGVSPIKYRKQFQLKKENNNNI